MLLEPLPPQRRSKNALRYVTLFGSRAGEQEKARFEKLFCAIFCAKILST
jgi:hypothetical protein